jgi:hypothetical protein
LENITSGDRRGNDDLPPKEACDLMQNKGSEEAFGSLSCALLPPISATEEIRFPPRAIDVAGYLVRAKRLRCRRGARARNTYLV